MFFAEMSEVLMARFRNMQSPKQTLEIPALENWVCCGKRGYEQGLSKIFTIHAMAATWSAE